MYALVIVWSRFYLRTEKKHELSLCMHPYVKYVGKYRFLLTNTNTASKWILIPFARSHNLPFRDMIYQFLIAPTPNDKIYGKSTHGSVAQYQLRLFPFSRNGNENALFGALIILMCDLFVNINHNIRIVICNI